MISDTIENSHIHFANPKNVRIDPDIKNFGDTASTSCFSSHLEFMWKESIEEEVGTGTSGREIAVGILFLGGTEPWILVGVIYCDIHI